MMASARIWAEAVVLLGSAPLFGIVRVTVKGRILVSEIDSNSSLVASDIATRAVVTIAPTATLHAAAELMREHGFNALPVVTSTGQLVGMIGIRDILRAPWPSKTYGGIGHTRDLHRTAEALRGTEVQHVMARRLVTAAEDTPISTVVAEMVDRGIHPIPIVENNILTGLVSRSDIVSLLLDE